MGTQIIFEEQNETAANTSNASNNIAHSPQIIQVEAIYNMKYEKKKPAGLAEGAQEVPHVFIEGEKKRLFARYSWLYTQMHRKNAGFAQNELG